MYDIHQAVHIHQDLNNQFSYQEPADAALNTLRRMMIDIAYAFNREGGNFDVELLQPTLAHILRSAHQHILTAEDYNNPIWLEDFDQIRRLLVFINRRWALAGTVLWQSKLGRVRLTEFRFGITAIK